MTLSRIKVKFAGAQQRALGPGESLELIAEVASTF